MEGNLKVFLLLFHLAAHIEYNLSLGAMLPKKKECEQKGIATVFATKTFPTGVSPCWVPTPLHG